MIILSFIIYFSLIIYWDPMCFTDSDPYWVLLNLFWVFMIRFFALFQYLFLVLEIIFSLEGKLFFLGTKIFMLRSMIGIFDVNNYIP